MFKKKKVKINLSEILSNDSFQSALEELDWEHAESEKHAWEYLKLKQLEDKSIFLAILLRAITNPLRLGDYVYHKRGFDLMERSSLKIKKKRKENNLFKITKEKGVIIK